MGLSVLLNKNETVFIVIYISFLFFVCVLIVYTYTPDLVSIQFFLSFNVPHTTVTCCNIADTV